MYLLWVDTFNSLDLRVDFYVPKMCVMSRYDILMDHRCFF